MVNKYILITIKRVLLKIKNSVFQDTPLKYKTNPKNKKESKWEPYQIIFEYRNPKFEIFFFR